MVYHFLDLAVWWFIPLNVTYLRTVQHEEFQKNNWRGAYKEQESK